MRWLVVPLSVAAACGADATPGGDVTFSDDTSRDTAEVVLQDPGIIAVSWTFPAGATCAMAGVESLTMRVFDGDMVVDSLNGPCLVDSGTFVMANLQPGSYDVVIDGLTDEGVNTHRGTVSDVVVVSDGTGEGAVVLTPRPASVTVEWEAPEGDCRGSGIEDVEVELVYDASTSASVQGSESASCDEGDRRFDGLSPNGDVIVVVTGLDAGGEPIARGQSDAFAVGAGTERTVSLALELCSGGCD